MRSCEELLTGVWGGNAVRSVTSSIDKGLRVHAQRHGVNLSGCAMPCSYPLYPPSRSPSSPPTLTKGRTQGTLGEEGDREGGYRGWEPGIANIPRCANVMYAKMAVVRLCQNGYGQKHRL